MMKSVLSTFKSNFLVAQNELSLSSLIFISPCFINEDLIHSEFNSKNQENHKNQQPSKSTSKLKIFK